MMHRTLCCISFPCVDGRPRQVADEDRRLLAEQLELLKAKKGEVEALRRRGGRAREGLADDLVGVIFVFRAALLAGGFPEANRELLEGSERVARQLLREVLSRQSNREQHT